MKLRKDWPIRLWHNRWWACRALLAFLLLAPLFFLEWTFARVIDATNWVAEKITEIGWKWNESEKIGAVIGRVTKWVGKPERTA